jgi:simple sugar transport system permease protein
LIVLFAGAMAQVAAPALFKAYKAFGGGRHG